MKRTEMREHIFRMVFSYEFNSDQEMPQQMQLYFEQLDQEPKEEDMAYIRDKALNIILKSEEIDEMHNEHVTGWKTSRMNKVDLTVLRLAVYEMKYDEEVPTAVAINEAVELARRFGGDDSTSFVNGILGKVARETGGEP